MPSSVLFPKHVLKRDGSVRSFDVSKIVRAVEKAGKATQEFDSARARSIVEERVMPKLGEYSGRTLHIEQIQDAAAKDDIIAAKTFDSYLQLIQAVELVDGYLFLFGQQPKYKDWTKPEADDD